MMEDGTILIEKHAACPQCFHLKDSFLSDWMEVTHNLSPHEFEKQLSAAGWTFFYMVGVVRTTAFGFNRAKMIHAALKRLVTNVRQRRCNCLEIDDVATHSLLGLPYVNVSAHPRHIQKGAVFSGQ
jgi:hypothetical protein